MNINVKQRDITDCGAACLASVAAFYKVILPVSLIRQYAGTDRKGTNILGMVEAAAKMGFLAKGVRGEWESIFKIPKPAIAHVIVKEVLTHYVVIISTNEKFIEIMDPGDGQIHKVPHELFKKEWTGVLILLTPGERLTPRNEQVSLFSRIWKLIKPNQSILIQSLIGAMMFSVLGLATSLYVGKIVDHVIPGGNLNLLNLLGLAMIVIILFRLLLMVFQSVFILKTGQRIDASLILGYYQHLLKLPQSFFDNMRTGEIISRIGDAVKIRTFVNDISISLILNVFILFLSFIIMFVFFWKLALIILVIIPVYSLVYLISDILNKKTQRKVMERAADLEAQLVESLNSAGTIKRFNLEDYSNFKTETRFVAFLETMYKSGLNSIFSSGSGSYITQLITVMVLWIGATFVLGNQITPGELLSFYAVVGYFTGPVTGIIGFNRTLQDAKIAADRLFEIFDLEIEDDTDKIELTPKMVDDIVFEKVKFRYGTRVEVFNALNLRIKRGEITAITGESGSGKTTLVSLLQNLYSIQEGKILIGNYELKHFTNKSIRSIISLVPQKIDLFAGDIIENIAIGELDPDINKVAAICEKLGMTGFVEELPNGFRTHIGENGATLSGGQKQRIAIARALYRDPDVLILDEATSSLDSSSEEFVRNAIKLLKKENKTVIIVAHRLSTITLADNIIVLDNGAVVQEGNLTELSITEGKFRKMWPRENIMMKEIKKT